MLDELSLDEIEAIERRMRDPDFSRARFLGDGESLPARIRADAAVLHELGVTHAQVADRLEHIIREADRHEPRWSEIPSHLQAGSIVDAMTLPVDVEGQFEVRFAKFMGWQSCPFGRDWPESCGSATRDIQIRNVRSDATIYLSELMIHLVRDHQFFEGEGLDYRLDPKQTVEVLELQIRDRAIQEDRS